MWYVVLFYLVVMLCLQVPETVNEYFHHSIPGITIYFIPLLVVILIGNLLRDAEPGRFRIIYDRSDSFFLLFILYFFFF